MTERKLMIKCIPQITEMALEIKKVIFKNPATIVFWADGTKTVVKAKNEDFEHIRLRWDSSKKCIRLLNGVCLEIYHD